MKAVRIIVHGLVQGVFFRQSTQEKARSLNLNGTVRNCSDGTVEIFAEGDDDKVNELIEWCKKGPPWSKVSKVFKEDVPAMNVSGFKIVR